MMNNLKEIEFLNEDYFIHARDNMVLHQLIPFGVKNPALLRAFSDVPREVFLDVNQKQTAYADTLIPLNFHGIMLPPHFLGRLLEEAPLDSQGKAMVIGVGSGYASAILSSLMSLVFLLESHKVLALKEEETMKDLGLDNIFVIEGPLTEGVKDQGVFDLILIEGAITHVPSDIFDQLSPTGVLLTFINRGPSVKEATCFRKQKCGWRSTVLFEANVPILHAFETSNVFSF